MSKNGLLVATPNHILATEAIAFRQSAFVGFAEGDEIAFEHTPDGEVKLRRCRDTSEWVKHLRETYKGRLPEGYRFSREDVVRRGYE